jgi:hypothetical protein
LFLSGCSAGPSAIGDQVKQKHTQGIVPVDAEIDNVLAEMQAQLLLALKNFVAGRDQNWFNDPSLFRWALGLAGAAMLIGLLRSVLFWKFARKNNRAPKQP